MNAAQRLAECRAVLGGEYDAMRSVWDEQATDKDRRLLLAMAGRNASITSRRAGVAWCDLSAVDRGDIAAGLRKFSAWAERLK